ncbi:MAG: xanthine dehydrogenase accessory protein XdhC [Planctomycetota bacterium]|nr:xanthine dehydrogenase accessory protein XdhC [Planctomycetota bacterium]MBM4056945.1 xanthine dehydrogenase accessory protein XdhC [Planctomycetota bacterium]
MPAPHGLIERLAEMAAEGRPFVLVTLAEAVGSTPQDAGTKMLVDVSGLRFGTVGGGKVEQQAIATARAILADPAAKPCTLLEWNLKRDVGMTCGGTVKLLFEAYHVHPWRVVVFGAGHVGQAVVRCLLLLDCEVACVDSRAEWLSRLPDAPKLEKVRLDEPRDFVPRLRPGDHVLCMTMGHATDRPILEALYRSGLDVASLGVIGSRAKREVLRRELEAAGVPTAMVERLRCPIGLPVGSNQPGEIAVSVAAELLQIRDAARGLGSSGS